MHRSPDSAADHAPWNSGGERQSVDGWGRGDHSGRRPEPDARSIPRRYAARAKRLCAVYTYCASATVSLVVASGAVTSAIMACPTPSSSVLDDGRGAACHTGPNDGVPYTP